MAYSMNEAAEKQTDAQKGQYLTFTIENESYGVDIKSVTEIIGMQAITPMPELPSYVLGIINLRGKIIPVMDIRLRFKKQQKEFNNRTCVIVVDIKGISVGLIVDSVSDVLSISETEIVPPPEVTKGSNKYICGIGKVENEVVLLLDCDKLINDEDAESISNI